MAPIDPKQRLLERLRSAQVRIGLLIIALVGAVIFGGYQANHYVTRESAYCVSCHSNATQAVSQHAHKRVPCQDCHAASFSKGAQLTLRGWFGANVRSVVHGETSAKSCRSCHLNPKSVRPIGATSGHIAHVINKPQLTCGNCHELKSHGTKVDESACARCHSTLTMHDSGMARVTCLSCHDYKAAPTADGSIPAIGCPKCHSGRTLGPNDPDRALQSKRTIAADVTHGNVNACRLCHDPHAADAKSRRSGMDCDRCHKGISAQAEKNAVVGHPGCGTCHQIHGPRPHTPGLCAQCHSKQLASTGTPTLSSRHENCSACHKPHAFKITRAVCASCHKQENATLAAWTDTRHSDCLTCHQGHSETKPAANCANCHKDKQAHGHPDCIKCHEPHQGKSAVKNCLGCHGAQAEAVAAQKPAPHRVCATCHDPHNAGATVARCGNCHQAERAATAKAPIEQHKKCTSCHQQHQFQRLASVCLNCHKADQRGTHAGACLKCHQAHGPPASPELTCRTCHQQVPEIQGKHAQCTTCHAAHKSAKGGPLCSACHTSQFSGASQWKPEPHRQCQSCHSRHAPLPPKACAECHAPIASNALFKGHRCQGCHNPHQAPVPWFNRCEQCHASEAAGIRGLPGAHANCKGCHEPHGNQLPTCQNCHQGRPGVHATPGHEKCRSCHETHAVKVQSRTKCLTCHADKKDHFPAAAQCAACHIFK